MSGSSRKPPWRGLYGKAKKLFTQKTNQHPYRLGGVATGEALIDADQFQYDWSTIGMDHRIPVPQNKPVIKAQMNYLKSFGISFMSYSGTDTYGHLWKVMVKQRETGRKDVLISKVLSLNTFDSNKYRITTVKEAVNGMFREIKVLRRLIHPNIIRLEYVVKIPDSKTGFPYSSVCMLLEYTDGTLSDLIHRSVAGLLVEDECREWFGQIAEAIRYLHHKNMVHMNIKPESIRFVIKNNKMFKLSDFCYSNDFGEGMSTFSNVKLMGKYMAPEVRGEGPPLEGYDTKAADIWSLCVTLIVALTGLQSDPQTMLEDLRSREWMNIKYMAYPPTPSLAELMILMSEIDPNDRLNIDEVCAHNWLSEENNTYL